MFIKVSFLKIIRAQKIFLRKSAHLSVYSRCPCFSGALIFRKSEKGFFRVVFAKITI